MKKLITIFLLFTTVSCSYKQDILETIEKTEDQSISKVEKEVIVENLEIKEDLNSLINSTEKFKDMTLNKPKVEKNKYEIIKKKNTAKKDILFTDLKKEDNTSKEKEVPSNDNQNINDNEAINDIPIQEPQEEPTKEDVHKELEAIDEPIAQIPSPPLCPNALYDENKDCNYIHPNMVPIDELNRVVPMFSSKNKAWDFAELEIYDESSKWYMCGFTLMEGYYNDETIFYYAYMKACPN